MGGSELRSLRKEAGYTALRLATELEMSAATFSKYEHDHVPIPKKVELAVRYLCEPRLLDGKEASVEQRLVAAIKEVAQS